VAWSELWRNISAKLLTGKANGHKLNNIFPKILVGLSPRNAMPTPG